MNLLKQFQVNLSELLGAVAQGRALHNMRNIADSGAPFENAFIKMLTRQLPPTYLIRNGYFYSPDSCISNEIDIIISLARESFNLEMSQQNKPVLPYTSILTTIQLKNSYSDLDDAIKQSDKSMECWKNMASSSMNPRISKPISVVICGCKEINKNTDRDFINSILSKDWLPDYILLLECGVIITRQSTLFPDDVSFHESLTSGKHNGFTVSCTDETEKPALALLWLYYAITARLTEFDSPEMESLSSLLNELANILNSLDTNLSYQLNSIKQNTRRHSLFSDEINRTYPLISI